LFIKEKVGITGRISPEVIQEEITQRLKTKERGDFDPARKSELVPLRDELALRRSPG